MLQKSDIKVLLAEDDLVNAKLLTELLQKKYNVVVTAYDGIEGIEKFKLEEFDVVVSDIEMPRCNGLEMITEIKKIKPSIFTILQTAYTEASYFIEAINLKVDRFLPKPINAKLLLSYIDEQEEKIKTKRLIEEQQKLLNHYKQVIDDILIVVKTDTEGKIKYVNDKFCEISGYTQDEIIGKTHPEIVSHHTLMKKELFDEMWTSVESLKPHHMIIRNQNKSGSSYWIDSYFYPITDNNNNLFEVIAFSKDITAQIKQQKEKESLYVKESQDNITKAMHLYQTQFIKYIPLPTIIIDSDSNITEYNHDFENLILNSTNIELYEKLLEKTLKITDILEVNNEFMIIESDIDSATLSGISEKFNIKSKNISQNQTLMSFINVH
jgi:PAS domain S-box-containing protein